MKLVDGDAIVTAFISRGQGEYFVTTNTAQTLRFSDDALRTQGRVGQGVAAMALGQNAYIVSACYHDSELATSASNFLSLLVITESGLGKKVPVSQYPQKRRATAGVVTTELLGRDDVLLSTIISEDDFLLITWNGDGGEQVSVLKTTELEDVHRARKDMPLVSGHVLSVIKLS